MTPKLPDRRAGFIWRINVNLLAAFGFGWLAWAIWPDTIEWWQFRLLAILIGIGAFATLVGAFKEMIRLYRRDKMIAEFELVGRAPKSSQLADNDALRKAGMIE